MEIKKLSEVVHQSGVKALLYGQSGSGKTYSISTITGDKLILSAESGLRSLKDIAPDIDVAEINTLDDAREAYNEIKKSDYETIILDSISEIAEQVLISEKGKTKDGRQAYGELQAIVIPIIKSFRDLNKNVIFTAKMEKTQTDTGAMLYGPGMPGNRLKSEIPYLFDEVFCLRLKEDENGKIKRAFQTGTDFTHEAKDRSGKLAQFEPADWSVIFNKITGEK